MMAPPASEVVLQGRGMHTGCASRVVLRRSPGPVRFVVDGVSTELGECVALHGERATRIRIGNSELLTVEHLFAALGALGIYQALEIEVSGAELPLLDGAAHAYATALAALQIAPTAPRLRVVRDAVLDVQGSRYDFATSSARSVCVDIDFGDPRLARHAEWNGDPGDFMERVASARTFAPESDVNALMEAGLASHVTKESVVVIGTHAILSSGAPFTSDEPARHKLLDLMGDLYLYGGPPIGHVFAEKPGHSRTHEAMRQAFAQGIVAILSL